MKPHVLVVHRWRDSHSHYPEYIDHGTHNVTYVCTELAARSVPVFAAASVTVAATDRLDLVLAAARDLIDRFGQPERVVALNEGDLDTAAELRARLGVPGDHPAQVAPFRDKLTMAEAVASAGVAIPDFADAPDIASVVAFADAHGWPLIVKPRRGTASRGVLRLDSVDDLGALAALDPEPRLVQRYCPDQVFHVDGLWTGTDLGAWRASRYVNTCVEFTAGFSLGSVEVDDAALLAPLGEFVAAACKALSVDPWVFHMEVFVGTHPDGSPRLHFLEAGARVGGAEIPFVWREVHGVDLMAAAVDIQMGVRPRVERITGGTVGGWLLVPTPVPTPCTVLDVGLDVPDTDGPYARIMPEVGALIPKVGGYEHVGARFRFAGTSTDEVERRILRTAAATRLDCAEGTAVTT